MALSQRPDGVTMMLRVPQGAIVEADTFYQTILERPHDFHPSEDIREWELKPDVWLMVVEGTPPSSGRIRFGTNQIDQDRVRIQRQLKVDISPIETLERVVSWCNFDDPWGNSIGLFQDLAKWPKVYMSR